jgi:hypothetical protein
MTDNIAERVRKLGGTTIRSIVHIARLKDIADNDAEFLNLRAPISLGAWASPRAPSRVIRERKTST